MDYVNPLEDMFAFRGRSAHEMFTIVKRSWKISNESLLQYIESGEVDRKKFYSFLDKNNNDVYDKGDKFRYYTYVYTSKDPIKLLKIFHSIDPGADEILLFIEDNTGDTSTQKHYVKVGSDIKATLKKNQNYVNYSKAFKKLNIGDGDDDVAINELIKKSVAEIGSFESFIFTMKVIFSINLMNTISVLDSMIDGLRGLKHKDSDWNSEAEDLKNEKYFTPYYFPFVKYHLKKDRFVLSLGGVEIDLNTEIENLHKEIEKGISQRQKELESNSNGFVQFVDPLGLRFIPSALNLLLLDLTKGFMTFLTDFVGHGIMFYNALICGFLNSIIEVIAGLLDLVNLVFKGMNFLLNANNWDERMDNFSQAIANIDFNKVWKEFIALAKDVFPKLVKALNNYSLEISMQEVGYYLGYLLGLILEFILTEGIGTVKTIITKAGSAAGKLFRIILDFIESLIGKTSGKRMAAKLDALVNFLKKGTDNFVESIRKFRRKLHDYFDEGAFKHLEDYQIKKVRKQRANIDDIKSKDDFTKFGNKSNIAKGNWAEMYADQFVLDKFKDRWMPFHEMIDDMERNYGSGIDHIYKNLDFTGTPPPPKYLIMESKGFSSTLSTLKDGTKQMSPEWIEDRIDSILELYELNRKTYKKIKKDMLKNHEPVLFELKDVGEEPILTVLEKSKSVTRKGNAIVELKLM